MNTLLTFIAYELVWFAAVIGAGRARAWPGVCAAALFIAWRLTVSRRRALEVRLCALALLLGAALETVWVRAGLIRYAAAWPLESSPAWLLALWASFGLTIVPLFGYLHSRPWLAATLGALGGPASYWAAARGWHAVIFPVRPLPTLLALSVGWAAALPALTTLARRWLPTASARSGA
ncbi:MAG: DUF2878 domain-containing protein [Steroidobacteraceae bacterium]